MTDKRSLYGMIFGDPCLVIGCVHDYGHEGKHEYEAGQLEPFFSEGVSAETEPAGDALHTGAVK